MPRSVVQLATPASGASASPVNPEEHGGNGFRYSCTTAPAALPSAKDDPDFVLVGVPAIAEYLGESIRTIYHLISIGSLPVFKLPGSVHWRLRPSTLRELYLQLESEAMAKAAERRARAASANGAQEAPPPDLPSRRNRSDHPRDESHAIDPPGPQSEARGGRRWHGVLILLRAIPGCWFPAADRPRGGRQRRRGREAER